jgi:hypothetical protein
MNRKGAWITVGLFCAGVVLFSLANAFAQRGERPGAGPGPGIGMGFGPVGRYSVVSVSTDSIVLLDTVTGDLYKASPRDIKNYSDRPRPEMGDRRDDGFRDKDKAIDRPREDRRDIDKRPADKDGRAVDRPRIDDRKDKDKDKERPSS